jgi:hypothetical protein
MEALFGSNQNETQQNRHGMQAVEYKQNTTYESRIKSYGKSEGRILFLP